MDFCPLQRFSFVQVEIRVEFRGFRKCLQRFLWVDRKVRADDVSFRPTLVVESVCNSPPVVCPLGLQDDETEQHAILVRQNPTQRPRDYQWDHRTNSVLSAAKGLVGVLELFNEGVRHSDQYSSQKLGVDEICAL